MLKVFALIPSRSDISVEQFHSHWRDVHGPLATRITTLRGYVQSHSVREGPTGLPRAAYRGVAEVWFDDLETAAGMGTDPDYVHGCGADEPNFIDRSGLSFLFTRQRVLLAGPPVDADAPETKAMLLLSARRSPAQWGSAALEDRALALPGLRELSLSVSDGELRQDGQPFDAVMELSWADIASYDRAWASPAGDALRDALREVSDPTRSAALLTQPVRFIWPVRSAGDGPG